MVIGDVALISVKNAEDAHSYEIIEAAEEILRRHPRLKAVYAKIETEGVYRIPKLILVTGEPVIRTWHKENGLYFRVTLGYTYFNPKLATEHLEAAHIASKLGAKYVADLFSGVGGYTITIGAYADSVRLLLANDLNPSSIADLTASIYRNRRRLKGKKILTLCEDAHNIPSVIKNLKFDLVILDYPQRSEEFIQDALKITTDNFHLLVYRILNEDTLNDYLERLMLMFKKNRVKCTIIGTRPVLDYAPRKYVYRIHISCER